MLQGPPSCRRKFPLFKVSPSYTIDLQTFDRCVEFLVFGIPYRTIPVTSHRKTSDVAFKEINIWVDKDSKGACVAGVVNEHDFVVYLALNTALLADSVGN